MSRRFLTTTATVLACSAAMFAMGCSPKAISTVQWEPDGMPRHWHPEQQWWQYEFIYHPQQQVYFNTYTEQYYWYEDGIWHDGPELPGYIMLDPSRAKVVQLWSREPHAQHDTVVAQHGPWNRAYAATPWSEVDTGFAQAGQH